METNLNFTLDTIQASLKQRHTSKAYKMGEKIDEASYQMVLESANLAPTSFGLQGFKILEITDQKTKEAILPIAYGQTQIVGCDKLLVWAVETDMVLALDKYIERVVSSGRQNEQAALGFRSYIKGFLDKLEDVESWNAKQAYISLGFALYTSALLGLESTPMEGFNSQELDKLLGLTDKGLKSVVILTLGVGDVEDSNKTNPKVRKSMEELVIKTELK
jgi:nitroreductase / dihydropteridine reductase